MIQRIFVWVPTAFTLILNTFLSPLWAFLYTRHNLAKLPFKATLLVNPGPFVVSQFLLSLIVSFADNQNFLQIAISFWYYYPCQKTSTVILFNEPFFRTVGSCRLRFNTTLPLLGPSADNSRCWPNSSDPLKSCCLDQKELEVSKNPIAFFQLSRLRYVCIEVVLIQRVDFGSLSL